MRRALLLALAALVAAPVLGQTTAPSGLDLRVTAVDIPLGAPRLVDTSTIQNDRTPVRVTIHNNGSAIVSGYQLTFQWVSAEGQASPLNGGEAASTDVWEQPLRPRESRTHELRWTLQPGQEGAGAVRVSVQAAGTTMIDARPADNVGQLPATVETHRLMVEAIGPAPSIHPGETVFLRTRVHNEGNVRTTAGVQVLPGPGAGRLQLAVEPDSVEVPPGESREALVFVTLPLDDDTTAFAASLDLRASRAIGALHSLALGPIRSTFEAYGSDDYTFSLSGSQGTLHASPGSPASAYWTVRNTGLQPDIYTVSLAAPGGWSASAAPDRFVLDPAQEQAILVTLEPPQSGQPGEPADVALAVESVHPVPARQATILARVAGGAPEVAGVAARSPSLYMGDQLDLEATLRNQGNAPLLESTLAVEARMPDGSLRSTFIPVPPMDAGRSQPVPVALGLASSPGVMKLAARWFVGEVPMAWQGEIVLRQADLALTPPIPGEGMPGQAIDYAVAPASFRLRNLGALAETWHVHASVPTGAAQLLEAGSVTLLPGQSRSIPVRQVLPAGGNEGMLEVPITLTATLAERPALEWSATALTRVTDRVPPSVMLAARPGSWSVGEPLQVRADVHDLSGIRDVLLHVSADGSGRIVPMERIGNATWVGDVAFLAPGEHELQVRATDVAGNEGSARAWNVTVETGPVPRLTAAEVPDNGTWPLDAPIVVQVQGAAPSVRYQVLQDGALVADGTAAVHAGVATVPLHGLVPGEAVLRLEAASDSGPVGELVLSLSLVAPKADEGSEPAPQAGHVGKDAPALLLGYLGGGVAWAAAVARRRRGPEEVAR